MDKVFLDTNIVLDYLAARSPFDQEAKIIFQRAELKQITLCISVLTVCNISYILRKLLPGSDIKTMLTSLCSLVELTPIDDLIISESLASDFTDFEDAVQYFSAYRYSGVTHLLTRNIADFAHSQVPIFTPNDYILNNP